MEPYERLVRENGIPMSGTDGAVCRRARAAGERRVTNEWEVLMALFIDVHGDEVGRVVLRVRGAVDLGDIEHLRGKLSYAAAWRPYQLVVDLRGVTFLGSAGLACLTITSLEARTAGCTLYVVAEHLAVTHPIRSAELAGALELYPRVEDIPPPEVPLLHPRAELPADPEWPPTAGRGR